MNPPLLWNLGQTSRIPKHANKWSHKKALADQRRGTRDACPPLSPISFIFMQFLAYFCTPLWDWRSPRKSWIRHCRRQEVQNRTISNVLKRIEKKTYKINLSFTLTGSVFFLMLSWTVHDMQYELFLRFAVTPAYFDLETDGIFQRPIYKRWRPKRCITSPVNASSSMAINQSTHGCHW